MRSDNAPAQRLYERYGFTRTASAAATTPGGVGRAGADPPRLTRRGRWRLGHVVPAYAAAVSRNAGRNRRPRLRRLTGVSDEPLVLGIETSCDETGVGIVRGHDLLADAVASSVDEHARFGGVVPGGRQPRPPRGDGADGARALDDGGRAPVRRRRDRGHRPARASPARCSSASPRPRRYAIGARRPAVRRQPPGRARRGRPLEHGPLPAAVPSRCSSPAATPRCCWSTTSRGRQPLGATIDDAAGEAFDKVARLLGLPLPRRPATSTAPRRRATAAYVDVPARPDRPRDLTSTATTSRSPASRPRSPAGSRPGRATASRCRWPTSPRRSRRPWSTC